MKKPVYALVAAILASSMAFIDSTALNVALPAIQKNLDLSGAQLIWVVNGYTLFLASLMLAGGALGDIYGKKRVFTTGVFLFVIASLGCGLSPNGFILILLRSFQGMAAALMVPGSLALISAVYPKATKGRAIGYWSMFSALTTILGPVLGGYLASIGWWRVVFFINVPLGIAALILLFKYVKEPEIAAPEKALDIRGAILSAVSLTLIVFSFIQGGEHGFDRWYLWISLVVGIFLFAIFIRLEKHHKSPLLRISLFRSRVFTVANSITFFIYGGLGVFMYFLPLNLIQIQGYSAELAGIATLPFGICIALLAPLSGKWIDRVGPRIPLFIGPLLTGFGFWGFSLFGIT
ncbi:MAG TPA: MFS transporter, partial [Cryomorphaceae bacterium]|nr:MFS transporter [Cryomorphaceae bacterium]